MPTIPPLPVRLALHGVGVQQRQRPRFGIGQLVHILGHLLPFGLRVNGQAMLRADGDVKLIPQRFPHIGGDHQPALGVDGVIGLAHQSGHSDALLPTFWVFVGFDGTNVHIFPTFPHHVP